LFWWFDSEISGISLEDEDDDEHEAAVATLWRALAGVGRDVGLAKSGRLIR